MSTADITQESEKPTPTETPEGAGNVPSSTGDPPIKEGKKAKTREEKELRKDLPVEVQEFLIESSSSSGHGADCTCKACRLSSRARELLRSRSRTVTTYRGRGAKRFIYKGRRLSLVAWVLKRPTKGRCRWCHGTMRIWTRRWILQRDKGSGRPLAQWHLRCYLLQVDHVLHLAARGSSGDALLEKWEKGFEG